MKYAIMSDVHANPKALETALADARRLGCGKFILLGDVTGYGYDPKATLEIVRRNFDVVLMGNHDSACVELEPEWEVRMNNNYDFDRKARELLSEEERAWLCGYAPHDDPAPALRLQVVHHRDARPRSRFAGLALPAPPRCTGGVKPAIPPPLSGDPRP